MRNKYGFVPKSASIQPDYYREIFGNWTAIFKAGNGTEFHIGMVTEYWRHRNHDTAKQVEVLIQKPTCRTQLQTYTSIRAALKHVERMLESNEFESEEVSK